MLTLLLIIHVSVCVLLILIILIQAGRSGGLAGFVGGGGVDALFSASSQQSGLRKITVIMAAIFLATSIGLTILGSREATQSVIQKNLPLVPSPNTQGPQ